VATESYHNDTDPVPHRVRHVRASSAARAWDQRPYLGASIAESIGVEVRTMAGLMKRQSREVEPLDVFTRFDRMFDEWMRLAARQPLFGRGWLPEDTIRVDEYRANGTLVIRAELPGIDPDRDVELTVAEGMLRIEAQRREEENTEEKNYVRHELRYGSFTRELPLPEGVSEADVTASYQDGVLEIRIPTPEPVSVKRIPIAKS